MNEEAPPGRPGDAKISAEASQPPPAADPAPSGQTPFEEHFRRPRNAGMLEDADGRVEVENPVCGDLMSLTWKLEEGRRVGPLRFQVYGCPAAIAAGSALTEIAAGAELSRLSKITAEDISRALGGLSSERFHAAVLAADALRALIGKCRR